MSDSYFGSVLLFLLPCLMHSPGIYNMHLPYRISRSSTNNMYNVLCIYAVYLESVIPLYSLFRYKSRGV